MAGFLGETTRRMHFHLVVGMAMGLSGHRRAYCMMLLGHQTYYSLPRRMRTLFDLSWTLQNTISSSTCRQETMSSGGIRGSGGVACFVRDSLQSKISLVATNEFARFIWVWVCHVSPLPRNIYIIICYFPPASSSYAIHNGPNKDPFIDLYDSITQYMDVGEVVLLGDFNSRTRALQIPLHDRPDDMFCIQKIDPKSVGLHQMFDDALGPLTTYGRHLLHLGESQELLILNELPCFPDSHFFMCWPHGGGTRAVDYVISSHNLLPFIHHFYVSPIRLADHALLSFSLRADTPPPATPPQGPSHTIF
jgi:hypothetical protein